MRSASRRRSAMALAAGCDDDHVITSAGLPTCRSQLSKVSLVPQRKQRQSTDDLPRNLTEWEPGEGCQ
jgi:hypothetical protein